MSKVMIHPADYDNARRAVDRAFELFPVELQGKNVLIKPNPDKPEPKKSSCKDAIVKFAFFSYRLFSFELSPQRRRVRRGKQSIFTGRYR